MPSGQGSITESSSVGCLCWFFGESHSRSQTQLSCPWQWPPLGSSVLSIQRLTTISSCFITYWGSPFERNCKTTQVTLLLETVSRCLHKTIWVEVHTASLDFLYTSWIRLLRLKSNTIFYLPQSPRCRSLKCPHSLHSLSWGKVKHPFIPMRGKQNTTQENLCSLQLFLLIPAGVHDQAGSPLIIP